MIGIILHIPTLKRSLGNGSCTCPQKRTKHLLSLITPSWRWADTFAGLFTSLAWTRRWGIMKPLCAVKMDLLFTRFMDGVSMLKIQEQLWLSSHLKLFKSICLNNAIPIWSFTPMWFWLNVHLKSVSWMDFIYFNHFPDIIVNDSSRHFIYL